MIIHERAGLSAQAPHIVAGYSRRTNLPSFMTRALTGGARWSHCGFVDLLAGVVIEAQMFKGVMLTPLDEWQANYPSCEFIRIACPQPRDALLFAYAQVGKGYDYAGAFGVPFRASWQDDSRWYCSEHLEASVAAGGRQRFHLNKHGISPMESWNAR